MYSIGKHGDRVLEFVVLIFKRDRELCVAQLQYNLVLSNIVLNVATWSAELQKGGIVLFVEMAHFIMIRCLVDVIYDLKENAVKVNIV
jgi:hypothetical protein